MTNRSLMFVLAALFAFTGAVAQAHVSPVLNDQQRLLDRLEHSSPDDPFKTYPCYVRLDNESSGTLRAQQARDGEICLLPTPPPQQVTPNLAIEV